jgi:hypothetical protein
MAEYADLSAAMDANDELAEARMRYRLLAETFEAEPKLRGNLNSALERAKEEILRLRAARAGEVPPVVEASGVVPFDADRFQKRRGRAGRG